MDLTVDELVEHYPRLFHMATGGSWPAIRQHGLLTTAHIVQTSGLPAAKQAELLSQRRTVSTVIMHPVIGVITIRDQSPLREQFIEAALTDMTIGQWLELLNDRVFLWLHPDKLHRLLSARRYRGQEHDVLTIDTRRLIEAYGDSVRLSPMNSGAALYPNAPPRGSATFVPVARYPFAERRKRRSLPDTIAELAVIGGIPDIASYVVEVAKYEGPELLELLSR